MDMDKKRWQYMWLLLGSEVIQGRERKGCVGSEQGKGELGPGGDKDCRS